MCIHALVCIYSVSFRVSAQINRFGVVCGVGCGLIRFLVPLGAGSRVVLGGSRSWHGGSGGFSVRSHYGFFAWFLEVLCGGSKGFGVGWGLHVLSFLPLGILPGLIVCGHLAARCSCYVWDRVDWIAPWFTLLKPVSPFVVLSCLSKGAGFHLAAALRTRLGTMLHMCCHRSVSRDITAFALHSF